MNDTQLKKYWLDFAERYCNQRFNPDDLPGVVSLFIENKIKEYRENSGVKSESLADMSVTYFDKELSREEINLLGQVRKLKTI